MSRIDWRFWSALCAAIICLSGPATAVERNICDDAQDPAASIADCTENINSGNFKGHELAAFYSNRAASYHALGDNERAVYDAVRAATRDEVLALLANGKGVMQALEALLRLRQAACHPALVPGQKAATSSKPCSRPPPAPCAARSSPVCKA